MTESSNFKVQNTFKLSLCLSYSPCYLCNNYQGSVKNLSTAKSFFNMIKYKIIIFLPQFCNFMYRAFADQADKLMAFNSIIIKAMHL